MFVKIYNSLFDYGLKPKELMVFLFLSYCQNCLGTATVRNATIQQRCGLSENTIRSAVAGLEQKGLLVVSARQDRDGRRISNQYKLLQLSGAWGKLPVEAFNLDKRDFAVYTYLCRCSNGQRKAFPSFSHMATVLHMAIGTVQTAIKSLVAAGRLLKAAFRAGKHNLYILVETVARALPGANPGAQKENRRAGTRRQVRDIAEKTIAHILYKLNILQLIGVCQGILSFTVSRVCQNLRNSNKTNPTYSTKERYFSLSKLAIGGEARLLEPDAGINGKAPLAQTEGFRMPPRFRTHSLPKLTELRLGMRMGFDESSYDDPTLPLHIIRKRRVHQLRDWAREQGLLPPMYYEDPVHGIDKEQLRELLIGIANGIMPDTYGLKLIKLHKCGPRVLREMRLCREAGMTGKEIRPYWALGVKKLQEVRAAFLAEKETDGGQ